MALTSLNEGNESGSIAASSVAGLGLGARPSASQIICRPRFAPIPSPGDKADINRSSGSAIEISRPRENSSAQRPFDESYVISSSR